MQLQHQQTHHRRKRRRRSTAVGLVLLACGGFVFPSSTDGYIVNRPTTKTKQQQQHQQLQEASISIADVRFPPYESLLVDVREDLAPPQTGVSAQSFHVSNYAQMPSMAGLLAPPDRTTSSDVAVLSPIEAWCLSKLDQWYSKSQAFKCPFLRRRSGDMLDSLESVMKHTVIRKACWPLMGPPQAHRPAGTNKKTNTVKYKGLSLSELHALVLNDWKPDTDGKGYYVTGKLTTPIYRDDCLFLGPDPDMPIHGLRKYVGVASHLFDYDTSQATLHVLEKQAQEKVLVAKWTLSGILRLPWRPSLPTFSGTTTYRFDDDGLIYCHEETWDCSATRAFCHTLFPQVAEAIWKTEQNLNDDDSGVHRIQKASDNTQN